MKEVKSMKKIIIFGGIIISAIIGTVVYFCHKEN